MARGFTEEGVNKHMSTYLVTGGAGFIGSHACQTLLKEGHHVRVLDNFSTGKRERLFPGIELFEADITNLEAIRPAFEGIDGVFHFAALPRIVYSIEHPIETMQANVMGTLNVLVAARDAKVSRLVYSASSSAYGDQKVLPLRPDMPAHPLNPYALHKYVGELLCEEFSRLYGLSTVCLRYFNVYGPRMADEGAYVTVIAIFRRQRAAGLPMTIHGDGGQTRDFTHVTDVVRANILAMNSGKVGNGEVLNVGAGEQHSVNEIAQLIGGPIAYLSPRVNEARDTLADTTLTKELLGWEPNIKFVDGLKMLLEEK